MLLLPLADHRFPAPERLRRRRCGDARGAHRRPDHARAHHRRKRRPALEYINLPHRIESIAAYNFENTLYLKNMKTDEYGCKYADNILLDAVDNGVKKIKIKDEKIGRAHV